MKFAYLMHTYREFEEIIETVNQLIKQGDHVFLMINDNDLRDKVYFVYADDPRVHISKIQEYAQEGDMSMARGTIIQMKEAFELDGINFDYYINLTDGMMPIKTREEIIQYLTDNPGNYYYVDRTSKEDPSLIKKVNSYYTLTNSLTFPKGKVTRWFTKASSKFYYALHIRRKFDEEIIIGSPYFVLNNKSANILTDNFDYVSENFKLSWYAEEMYIPMMLNKYMNLDHINDDLHAIGPNGNWIESQSARSIDFDTLKSKPNALFGGQILVEENPSLYEDYFDIYNRNYKGSDIGNEKKDIKVIEV